MRKVQIQLNTFCIEERPTTQEDNYAGIASRWNLYHCFEAPNKEVHSNILQGELVQYFTEGYAVFHAGNTIRYDFSSSDVKFI